MLQSITSIASIGKTMAGSELFSSTGWATLSGVGKSMLSPGSSVYNWWSAAEKVMGVVGNNACHLQDYQCYQKLSAGFTQQVDVAYWQETLKGYLGQHNTVRDIMQVMNKGYLPNTQSWWDAAKNALGFVEDKNICPWEDYQCHYQSLRAEFAQCNTSTCYWDTLKEYLGQYDVNAVAQDIYRNLSEQSDTMKIAMGVGLTATTCVAGLVLYRRYRNSQKAQDTKAPVQAPQEKKDEKTNTQTQEATQTLTSTKTKRESLKANKKIAKMKKELASLEKALAAAQDSSSKGKKKEKTKTPQEIVYLKKTKILCVKTNGKEKITKANKKWTQAKQEDLPVSGNKKRKCHA